MGNEQALGKKYKKYKEKYGDIFIEFDNTAYLPGETVNGNIYINLHNDFPGQNVVLKLKGEEKAEWYQKVRRQRQGPDGQPEYYWEEEHYKDDHKILKQYVPVFSFDHGGKTQAGQYTIPFSFMVPEKIPGSFAFKKGKVKAAIKYKATAMLVRNYKKDDDCKLKYKREVVIREKVLKNIEMVKQEKSINVTCCCCCDKGNVKITGYFDKNAYCPGEVAKVVGEIDATGLKQNLSSVNVTLVQNLRLQAEGKTKSWNFTILNHDFGPLDGGSDRTGENRFYHEMQLPEGADVDLQSFGQGCPDDDSDDEGNSHGDLKTISPSCDGKLVDSNYFINFSGTLDGCACCSEHPHTSNACQIYAPHIPAGYHQVQQPQNWAPQQMQTITINIQPGWQGDMSQITINLDQGQMGQNQQQMQQQ